MQFPTTTTTAAAADTASTRLHLVYTHVGAILGQRSIRLLADLLSVHLGSAAVVLCIGVVSGAAMLAEEGRLSGRGKHYFIYSRDSISTSEAPTQKILLNGNGWSTVVYRIIFFWLIPTYRVGVASDLHTSELKPVPVRVQLSGSVGQFWHHVRKANDI